MQVYLDANIYLEYFRVNSAERLAPLRELVKLVKSKTVVLLIPAQTRQEFYRNKRSIAEATRAALVKQRDAFFVPPPATLDKSDRIIKRLLKARENFRESYSKLIDRYDHAVEGEKTDADLLIRELFEKGLSLEEDADVIQRAYVRYMKGNPPRKNDHSYGDAITWETLLKDGTKDNLLIVSKDGDYIEEYKGEPRLSYFLYIEWRIKTKKKKRAQLFTSLAECVNYINNKQTIKKEIVEKEKALPESRGVMNVGSYVHSAATRPFFGELVTSIDQGILNVSPNTLVVNSGLSSVLGIPYNPLGVENSLVIASGGVSFCPYCGGKAERKLLGGHRCMSCGKEFQTF